jgi:hypothetical protein
MRLTREVAAAGGMPTGLTFTRHTLWSASSIGLGVCWDFECSRSGCEHDWRADIVDSPNHDILLWCTLP